MRKPNSIQFQDFFLVLTSQSSLFTLEAEHEPTGKVFTINLDGDTIGQVTNDLFDSADKLVQGLKEAAENHFENIKLEINSEGKLTYTAVLSSGVVNKEFSFTLNLTEKEMDPIQILSKRLESMEKWKETQEMKMEALETKMNSIQAFQARNDEKFDKLEKLMGQMEQRMMQKLEKLGKLYGDARAPTVFNKASENASHFSLTGDGKTVESILETGSFLEILPPLSSSGQSCYSLRMNNVTKPMGFGIIVYSNTKDLDWKDGQNRYEFWTLTGNIFGRVFVAGNEKGSFGRKDSILKMIIDMDQGNLTFFVDGEQANFCEISKTDQYLAFVDLPCGGSVTLV